MKCPECSGADLEVRDGAGKDPDTGYFDGPYAFCTACGESFDFADLDRMTEKAPAEAKAA